MRTSKYGVGVRKRVDSIKTLRAKKYQCPRCKKMSMNRLYGGVWRCKRCGIEVADSAYTMSVKAFQRP